MRKSDFILSGLMIFAKYTQSIYSYYDMNGDKKDFYEIEFNTLKSNNYF